MNMSVKEWDIIEENEEIKKDFQGFTKGLVRFGFQGWTFKPKTAEWMAEFQVILLQRFKFNFPHRRL